METAPAPLIGSETATQNVPLSARISPSPTMAITSVAHPPAVAKTSSARVVSSDSLEFKPVVGSDVTVNSNFDASATAHVVLPSQDAAAISSAEIAENSATITAMNKQLAVVLADPQAWLQSMDGKIIPKPPDGAFQGAKVADVLCGRGGESNHHPGNQAYRKLVKAFQPLYIASKRRYKPKISECIVYTIRSYGGRFLRRADPRRSIFDDVGNTKAREKTSQALREGAPELRGSAPSCFDNETNDNAGATGAASPTGLRNAPQGAAPAQYMNAHILRAQMDAYIAFGPSAFGAVTPFQQALLMGGANGGPSILMAPVGTQFGPVVAQDDLESEAGKKRSASSIVSEDSTSQTGSLSSVSITSAKATHGHVGGPRLKRLKQRLIEEHSEEDD
jgi:hypothetical protein